MNKEDQEKAFNEFMQRNFYMVPEGVPDILLKGFFFGGVIAALEHVIRRAKDIPNPFHEKH